MPGKTFENFSKKSENLSGQGFLRIQVIDLLLQSEQHLTVSVLQQRLLSVHCQYATKKLIGRIVGEISSGITTFKISETTVRAGAKSRAKAYLLIKN